LILLEGRRKERPTPYAHDSKKNDEESPPDEALRGE
jgi:hypothetical protein